MVRTGILRWILILAVLSFAPLGCASGSRQEAIHPERLIEERDAGRTANVLLIGDSISIGYFEPAKELLTDKAHVYHNPGNAQHTAYGLAKLDEWLGDTRWDVIHFNHGLHDMKYIDEESKRVNPAVGRQQVPIEQYKHNLEELTIRLKKTGTPLVFATTTPVPEGAFGRVRGDAARYNKVALQIMARHEVPVNDLYTYALSRLDAIQRVRDVHFTQEGSRLLAEQVAVHVLKAFAE